MAVLSRAPPSSASMGLDDDELGSFSVSAARGEVSQRVLLADLFCEVFPPGVLQACPTEFLANLSPTQTIHTLFLMMLFSVRQKFEAYNCKMSGMTSKGVL